MTAQSSRTFNLIWLTVYLVTIAGIVVGMVQVRTTVVERMSDPVETDKWLEWKADAGGANDKMQGHVTRRAPKSAEPPMLVLLRDHFPAVLIAVLAFYSLVFAFLWFIARGVFMRPTQIDAKSQSHREHGGH